MATVAKTTPIAELGAYEPDGKLLRVIIESPRGARNKFKYDPELGVFRLHKVLPAGAVFPFDFGYIPGTRAEDGDPLDALVLMDEPAFTGCLVLVRPVGVIAAEQTEPDGRKLRNDRVISVAAAAKNWKGCKSMGDLDAHWLQEMKHFFKSYNRMAGKKFEVLQTGGANKAAKLIARAIERQQSED